jgi:hypothetical protein
MRKSAIKVYRNDLIKAYHDTKSLEAFLIALDKCQKVNRYVVSKEAKKKSDLVEKANKFDTFNQILHKIRLELNHKSKLILAFNTLREVCILADQFNELFDLESNSGYNVYISIGLEFMTDFHLNKFKYYHQQIIQRFANHQKVIGDNNAERTSKYIKQYETIVGFKVSDLDRSKFIDVQILLDKYNVGFDYWVRIHKKVLEEQGIKITPIQLINPSSHTRFMANVDEYSKRIHANNRR